MGIKQKTVFWGGLCAGVCIACAAIFSAQFEASPQNAGYSSPEPAPVPEKKNVHASDAAPSGAALSPQRLVSASLKTPGKASQVQSLIDSKNTEKMLEAFRILSACAHQKNGETPEPAPASSEGEPVVDECGDIDSKLLNSRQLLSEYILSNPIRGSALAVLNGQFAGEINAEAWKGVPSKAWRDSVLHALTKDAEEGDFPSLLRLTEILKYERSEASREVELKYSQMALDQLAKKKESMKGDNQFLSALELALRENIKNISSGSR